MNLFFSRTWNPSKQKHPREQGFIGCLPLFENPNVLTLILLLHSFTQNTPARYLYSFYIFSTFIGTSPIMAICHMPSNQPTSRYHIGTQYSIKSGITFYMFRPRFWKVFLCGKKVYFLVGSSLFLCLINFLSNTIHTTF